MQEICFTLGRNGMERLNKRPSLARGTRLVYHYYAGNTQDYVLLDDETGRAAMLRYAEQWPDNLERVNEEFMEPKGEYDYCPGPFVNLDEYSRHIKDQFGIGIYYTDEVLDEAIVRAAEQSAHHAEQVIEECKAEEKRKWEESLNMLRQVWGGILKEYPKDTKERTDNIRAYLKYLYPGERFRVRKDGYDKAYVSWKDGRSQKEVQAKLDIWQTGHCDPTGDYWDDTDSAFTHLYGGWSYGVKADRCFTYEGEKKMQDEIRAAFPDIPCYADGGKAVMAWGYPRIGELKEWLGRENCYGLEWVSLEGIVSMCLNSRSLIDLSDTDKAIIKTNEKVFGECTPISTGLRIEEYSEKAIVVLGDTKPVAETLKSLGGKFNARLKCGAGWIFSKKAEARIKEAFGI